MNHWIERKRKWAVELVGEARLLGSVVDGRALLLETKREAQTCIRARGLRDAKPVRVWTKYERA
jgi:hypothetical protein